MPDPTTLADARAIVGTISLEFPKRLHAPRRSQQRDAKAWRRDFRRKQTTDLARPADALKAAEARAREAGYDVVVLGDRLQGEAREVAAEHARLAREFAAQGRHTAILSGGELTVTLRGGGRGGPNQEYALALAYHLGGAKGIAALAADTDGTDGGRGLPDDPAGAFLDGTTLARAKAAGLDPAAFLADNNSTGFFNGIGDLFIPGPTFTNVTDFRAILVDRPAI